MKKYVYTFAEGNLSMRNLLGGKGVNLCDMINLGVPVPPGFIVSTETCADYNAGGKALSADMKAQIDKCMTVVEGQIGKKFGDEANPLLVSVRSGARVSLPGMMDTVLNLGLNDVSVEALAKLTNNPRFAYDSYRRFIMMFADVVTGVDKHSFEHTLEEFKVSKGYVNDTDLTADDWKAVCEIFKDIYKKDQGASFPQDAKEQLYAAVGAVFRSWENERAIYYRKMNDIPHEWGTAVIVQSMVFGNMDENSGSGVIFSRNASTGENKINGDFLMNAQGEDVVAGIRTPEQLDKLATLKPEIYTKLVDINNMLEKHYRDMQDMEITIEQDKLYFLQTRSGKRTAQSAVKIAVDMVNEGMWSKEDALVNVPAADIVQLLLPTFDPDELKTVKQIGKGLNASPGAACGKVVFNTAEAKEAVAKGDKVILVRQMTTADDLEGMHLSQGILTAKGGMLSHAAVVAKGMGRCCVCGCEQIKFNEEAGYFELGGVKIKRGDVISLDGTTGMIYDKEIKTVAPNPFENKDFATLMTWADEVRTLTVRTNADAPKDALKALEFGAQGIGLTRTEHMFFEPDRIPKMRSMILADSEEERRAALNELLPFQRADFKGIFEAMKELPVTIRLLDPPLHEFMPENENDFNAVAKLTGKPVDEIKKKAAALHEENPMMGHRGCRLAVSYPEIAEMQTRAIIEAAIAVKKEKGYNIIPEIMIPLIVEIKELRFVKDIIDKTAKALIAESGISLDYMVGTMIEIPRACLTSDDIAKDAEFFSFGTNDLTQMTYGLSRDDAGKILEDYQERGIFANDPTAKLDRTGVGQLMKMSVDKGRTTRPTIKLGICGEHGGEPSSVEFCHMIGLDYVSCSPYRVPIARLAAAQAAIRNK
ncbi:MAG: pyruvate, phosphate dikinase [Defluviitaleaceae bacterium]|nr:pyruvate, phosphate dikinase [Defluviitaleaceae bacterium]